MSDDNLKLAANFKKRQEQNKPETPLSKYEKEIDEYKKLINDKVHSNNQTPAYITNVKSVLNRLLMAADELDAENPGQGIFGLIVLALRTNLALKDKNVELEVLIRDLDRRIKRLEQR
jgi:hypothetical protein